MEMSTQLFPGWISPPDMSKPVAPSPQARYFPPRSTPRQPAQSTSGGVGRPRKWMPKQKPEGWVNGRRREDVSLERIIELLKAGNPYREISKVLECNLATIAWRLRTLRESGPQGEALYWSLRTCACGRGRNMSRPVCGTCAAVARKGTA
jgi:hypothetical protein